MKKILIVNSNMQIGGIQKALTNMLNEIGENYQIDLLLFDDSGDLMESIPKSVSLLSTSNSLRILGRSNSECKKLGKKYYYLSCFLRLYSRYINNRLPIRLLIGRRKIRKHYDVAIAYMQPGYSKYLYGGCNEFILKNVSAKKKIAFVHCDYSKYAGNEKGNTNLLGRFDEVVCVSKSCAKQYIDSTNSDPSVVKVAYNFADYREIRRLANIGSNQFSSGKTHFITVARLTSEKGICETVRIMQDVVKSGITDFQWHIVGDGNLKSEIKRLISSCGLSDYIILHGETSNPYHYLMNASCMLICSLHEAAPMVYEEAACLEVPILTTKTCSSTELVVEKGYGIEAVNTDELLYFIKMIVSDKNYLDDYRDNLKKKNFTNSLPREQFEKLVGDKDGR